MKELINRAFGGVKSFAKDEEGASGIEYAILAAMVATALALYVTDVQTAIKAVFTAVKNALGVAA